MITKEIVKKGATMKQLQQLAPYMRTYADGDIYLIAYAWPGGYPVIYVDGHGDNLCAACASHTLYVDDPNDRTAYADIYTEGPDLQCTVCDTILKSAYGDLDSPEVAQ